MPHDNECKRSLPRHERLVRMVESDVKNPSSRNIHAGKPVGQLCADQTPLTGLSSLTIIEFHNTLATNWRSNVSEYEEYDQGWVERSQVKVMELIANQRLIVRSVPAGAKEHAISLVTLATRDHGNGLRVWDAIHLITAAAWARDSKGVSNCGRLIRTSRGLLTCSHTSSNSFRFEI